MMMERCNRDLASLLKQIREGAERAVNNYKVVARYIKDITVGVDFLHRQEIIHGDLKPGNILVKCLPGGDTMLLIGDLDDLVLMEGSMTCSGDISPLRGTVRYMSPEMLKKFIGQCGTENPGRKTDIWSLGCIMLEIAECFLGIKTAEKMLKNTKQQVSLANNAKNQFAALIMDGYVPVVDDKIPHNLASCIRQCLQSNPNERLSSAALLHKISVTGATESEIMATIGNATLEVVVMKWDGMSNIVKVVTLDSATERIRILEMPN
ncbi:serine/threonine-protein kinase Nek11-like [Paramacrobiotus metropolitanus]|uniref:serine/threonine-protein kinase Nek11-like n=1 Tax=Paramacrobiotus metropolitanus TaxID=2943436 RepID=UPI002445C739|nr:serine/threonine-protein kinase Nek11-like [Paramacrobiotus metropolitanus]